MKKIIITLLILISTLTACAHSTSATEANLPARPTRP